MTKNDNDEYSHDTRAIRDVADHDMKSIATDIAEVRFLYAETTGGASKAFTSLSPGSLSGFVGIGVPSVFGGLEGRWSRASDGISTGMNTSYGRVGDAARSLHKTADNYDHAEVRNTTNVDGLSRQLRDD